MGAFSIAFDTIIVGALALPCVLLVIHLFFSDNESRLEQIGKWVQKQNQPALAGVLLFAMAYPMGSAVSRIAQDFFDDDDLHFQVSNYLFRVGVTESSIRTDAYCHTFSRQRKVEAPKPTPTSKQPETPKQAETLKSADPVADKRKSFAEEDPNCLYTGRWIVRQGYHPKDPPPTDKIWIDSEWIELQEDLAAEIFRFQEAAVLLRGTDPNERLRQFHDQIMVLRGAAFNGIVALSLCLLWWSAKWHSWRRWAIPLLYLVPGVIATANHIRDHLDSPPYMEFTLLSLAAAGWYLLWQTRPHKKGVHPESRAHRGLGEIRPAYMLLGLFLTASAFLGWWATQVLYNQQVVYSYRAQSEAPAEPAKPSLK